MYLLLSIVLSTILCFILFMIGPPQIIGVIAFGIVLGCLFRGIYLLNDIGKRLSKIDKGKDALDRYLEEKENIN